MKKIASMAVWAAVAGVSLVVSAANLYVTPWYANPTCTERVCLNAANPMPIDTALIIYRKSRFDAPATILIFR